MELSFLYFEVISEKFHDLLLTVMKFQSRIHTVLKRALLPFPYTLSTLTLIEFPQFFPVFIFVNLSVHELGL